MTQQKWIARRESEGKTEWLCYIVVTFPFIYVNIWSKCSDKWSFQDNLSAILPLSEMSGKWWHEPKNVWNPIKLPMEQTQLSHQRKRLSNNRECLTISDRKGISDRQSGMQVLQIKKIRIVGYLVNIYHGAKQRPNSHTSGKSCTDAALVRMGALQSTIPGLSSSLVSASTSVLGHSHSS